MKSKTKKLLDEEFRLNVKLRAITDDSLIIKCFTCSKPVQWNRIDLGHWKKRKFLRGRYSYLNCKPQCRECNDERINKDDIFEQKIRETHGDKAVDAFLEEVYQKCTTITEPEAQSQLQKLRQENRKLKKKWRIL